LAIADIIIPVWNNIEYTKKCIYSILVYTHIPFKVIVVDDGSTDMTKAVVEETLARHNLAITYVAHDKNLGFTRAVNTGLKASTSDHVVVMNNDIIVQGHDWLKQMIGIAESDSKIGAVVATVNDLSSRQSIIFNTGESDIEDLYYFALSCALFPKRVIDDVGPLDESLDPNCQSDLDYAIRLREKGYRVVVARRVFMHHTKNATVDIHPLWRDENYKKENYELFTALRKKWGDEKVDELLKTIL